MAKECFEVIKKIQNIYLNSSKSAILLYRMSHSTPLPNDRALKSPDQSYKTIYVVFPICMDYIYIAWYKEKATKKLCN